jgi:glutathione S-transferase
MPQITLWFLQASRCIRTAWLLEELGLDYELKFSDRVNQKAPEEFKLASGNPLGKFPTLKDGNLTVYESGAISEYVTECDK